MTRTFNPFAFFYYASNAELDNVVSYLRDCVNTHEWEARGTPPSGVEFQEAGFCRHPIERLPGRIGRRTVRTPSPLENCRTTTVRPACPLLTIPIQPADSNLPQSSSCAPAADPRCPATRRR